MGGLSFRLGSIPVLVRYEFFILPVLMLIGSDVTKGAAWVAIVFFSVLIHELGHAWAMKLFGNAPRIVLHGMGGWTLWPEGAKPSEKQRLVVSLSGPGVELAAGVGLYFALAPFELPELAAWAREVWLYVNVFWGALNLLPVLPWDGGHALDSTVALVTGKSRARGVGLVSIVVGVGVLAAAIFTKRIMLGYLGGVGVWQGWLRWRGVAAPGAAPPEVDQAWELSAKGEHARAEQLLQGALAAAKEPEARAHLLEVLAWVRLSMGNFHGAEAAVKSMAGFAASAELQARLAANDQRPEKVVELLAPLARAQRLRPEAWPLLMSALTDTRLRDEIIAESVSRLKLSPDEMRPAEEACARLFYGGHIEAALVLCVKAFEVSQAPLFAFNAACCLCRLGRVDEGLTWLETAVKGGYVNTESIDGDPDLEPLRKLPGFAAVRERLGKAALPLP